MRVPTAVNLNIPVWILFLGSALVWYVSTLSQYIPLLGQYWLGWQYRFEPWQWVAAVCAVWALVVLVLLQDVRKYKILGQILAVVLLGLYVQKGYVEADVISAFKLGEKLKRQLELRIKSETGAKNVNLNETLDSSLLAGVIVSAPGMELDLSLKSKLAKLRA